MNRSALSAAAAFLALGFAAHELLPATPSRAAPPPAQAVPQSMAQVQLTFAPVVKRTAPAVVNVYTRSVVQQPVNPFFNDPFFRQFFGGTDGLSRQRVQQSLGSGVIVRGDGTILTNNHVIQGGQDIVVALSDKREFKAKVVVADPRTDLAVLKIDGKGENFPTLPFADSDKIQVGDLVLAVGDPFGVGQTVTMGIVSALARTQVSASDYQFFIQTDAAINPGNSGGALVDIEGRLIGIPSAIYSHTGAFQGAGFAVPSDLVRHELNSLVTTGKVSHGLIGVTVQNLNPDLAQNFGVTNGTDGALVSDVTPDSPAARAGIQSGDVITGLDGQPVKDSEALHLAIGEMSAGTRIKLQVLRDGKSREIALTTGSNSGSGRGADASAVASGDDQGVLNGVYIGDVDQQARQQFNIPERVHGAVITQVAPDSASAAAGLEPGDVILEINHHRVTDADQAVKLSEDATNKKTLLKLWSHGGTIYTLVDESGSPAS